MANFVVVKFDTISTYGTNPYKCVPGWWLSDSAGNNVEVPYPLKFQIFDGFKNIFNREPPLEGWRKCKGTIVHRTETYHEGLQFIHTQNPSYLPEELMFIQFISVSVKAPRKRLFSNFGLRIRQKFCRLF